jgi:diaminobutyrate-2-oxoglutarate transaminase
VDTIAYLRRFLTDSSSGVDVPAAILLETVQAEGGVNVARADWLRQLAALCHELGIVLIVDDIQVGNGRTGCFFSFEEAGIVPDLVVLSKAIGGGLPMSLLLIKPELDQWDPAEHNGTFRGNNLAFVAATTILQTYWQDDTLCHEVKAKEQVLAGGLGRIAAEWEGVATAVRGRGFIYGLELAPAGLAKKVSQHAFREGLIIETAGSRNQVVKCLPPLTLDSATLQQGLEIIQHSLRTALNS